MLDHKLRARWCRYRLYFSFTAITSRMAMTYKDTYFIELTDAAGGVRYGECALFAGLSADDVPNYEHELSMVCRHPLHGIEHPYSSIRFGFEQALMPRSATPWSAGECGIPINGLIWMGDRATMRHRVAEKLDAGYRVIKLKIGGINFDDELAILADIRREFSTADLEIRLDANGHFPPENVMARLDALAPFGIHSIEQPIAAGQPEAMARVCASSPIPIALDEELIGMRTPTEQAQLLQDIRPQYIILKPTLCGGFYAADAYIEAAEALGIGWWATSALESNIGLDAIAAWVAAKNPAMPQGLGTGQLYINNVVSPLYMKDCALWTDPNGAWRLPDNLQWQG